MSSLRQCVILVGGLGSRLGALTANSPKPLLQVGERPFLEILLWQAWRHGFQDVVLLAGHCGEQVEAFARDTPLREKLNIRVVHEPEPLGTGGALRFALSSLDPTFLLTNGDSLFDFNWLDLTQQQKTDTQVVMGLRALPDASRFGVVELDSGAVRGFYERGDSCGGLVNGGVYLMRREFVADLPERCSLEAEVLPKLAEQGLVRGRLYDGFFIDIGVPRAFAEASASVPAALRRAAIFFDRDGVLNEDFGHVGDVSRFQWIPGAREAIKAVNDSGRFAFVVTNQAGVAKGYYVEESVRRLHAFMQAELQAIGAHIDAFRFCPFHPEGTISAYARASSWRKPEAGMLFDLMLHWPVEKKGSFLLGDKASDLEAARRAGIVGIEFKGGRLDEVVTRLLVRDTP